MLRLCSSFFTQRVAVDPRVKSNQATSPGFTFSPPPRRLLQVAQVNVLGGLAFVAMLMGWIHGVVSLSA